MGHEFRTTNGTITTTTATATCDGILGTQVHRLLHNKSPPGTFIAKEDGGRPSDNLEDDAGLRLTLAEIDAKDERPSWDRAAWFADVDVTADEERFDFGDENTPGKKAKCNLTFVLTRWDCFEDSWFDIQNYKWVDSKYRLASCT